MQKDQVGEGILEETYTDGFNRQQFDSFLPPELEPPTERILHEYGQLIEKFSPAALEEEGVLPDALREGLAGIGIFGINIPKTYGGAGLSTAQYLKVLEAMARRDLALAIIPTAHLSIGLKGILLFGSEALKKKYLPMAASGGMIFAYALTEPGIGSDAQHIETQAELAADGSHYVLNGQKAFITNGGYAGGLTVFARLDPDRPGYLGAFVVETAWEGVTVGRPMKKMGLTISSTTSIGLKGVKVPVENMLGNPGDGFKIAMTILNYGRLGLGAASTGVMKQALEDMTARAKGRIQFGVPIIKFELIQEKIVKARVRSFAAEALTHFTAHLLADAPFADVAVESSHTKLYGTTRAWETLYDALQVAGGAGYLTTLPYEKRLRDFRVATIFEGTTEIHSIYPPLHVLRTLAGRLKTRRGGKLGQLLFVLSSMFRSASLKLSFDDATMQAGVTLVERNLKTIRRMLSQGMVRHGKRIVRHEFLLRRMTVLSLDLYILLAMLAWINARKHQGEAAAEETGLLAYFIEEARDNHRRNRRFRGDRKEELHRRIFQDIDGEEGKKV
jgi:acyl-CoA dehydrogenase family protein 9